jgi:hypothetical protein
MSGLLQKHSNTGGLVERLEAKLLNQKRKSSTSCGMKLLSQKKHPPSERDPADLTICVSDADTWKSRMEY